MKHATVGGEGGPFITHEGGKGTQTFGRVGELA